MPVRKIPKTYGSLSGQNASRKLNRAAGFESSLERDLFILLEFNSEVSTYEEQPLIIEYADAAQKRRTYTPDVLIVYRNETVSPFGATHILGEVKYRADLFAKWKELKPKFKAARAFCQKRAWRFQIFTEVEIRTPYLINARFLLPYKQYELEDKPTERLLQKLNSLKISNASQLLDLCTENETERLQTIPHIWHLTATGLIQADLNLPLNMNSPLWLRGANNG